MYNEWPISRIVAAVEKQLTDCKVSLDCHNYAILWYSSMLDKTRNEAEYEEFTNKISEHKRAAKMLEFVINELEPIYQYVNSKHSVRVVQYGTDCVTND